MMISSACQHFEDDRKGSIEVGKLADFAALSVNPMKVDPAKRAEARIVATIKKCTSVYRA